ncbi:MAG: PmoA family protein [Candidatus Zipacnadales bacterium]
MIPRAIFIAIVFTLGSRAGPTQMALKGEEGVTTLTVDKRPIFTYQHSTNLPKPFIHPFYTPAGHEITRLGPDDHVHHRGLMFALGNVAFKGEEAQYVVFWGETGAPDRLGTIREINSAGWVSSQDGATQASQYSTNEWRRISDDALMLTEQRRITYYDIGDKRCNLITWETKLTSPERDLVLGPTEGREVSYYGLGLRTAADMDGGRIFDANGKEGEAEVLGDNAKWCAYIGPNEPLRGFVMFDHPANPRYPTGWFVMSAAFGYMTASIVCHEPYELAKGEQLRLRYGVCAFDGMARAEDIEQWYQKWIELED